MFLIAENEFIRPEKIQLTNNKSKVAKPTHERNFLILQ